MRRREEGIRNNKGEDGRMRESSKGSRWMMLLDSISCPTVPPAIGHAAGSICSCVFIHMVVFVCAEASRHVIIALQNQKCSCVCMCVYLCAHCEINSAQLIRLRWKMRQGHTWAHLFPLVSSPSSFATSLSDFVHTHRAWHTHTDRWKHTFCI